MHLTHTPDVRLTIDAHEKLECWTDLADGEVSGLGLVSVVRNEEGYVSSFVVDDVYLLEQRCTPASTTLDPQAVAGLMERAALKGLADNLRLWWHSHADMDVFWSATDEACIQRVASEPWFLSLVCNKAGERRARLDVFEPFRMTADKLPSEVIIPEVGYEEQCREEFDEKVTERPRRQTGPRRGHKLDPEEFLMPEVAAIAQRSAAGRTAEMEIERGERVARHHEPFFKGGH